MPAHVRTLALPALLAGLAALTACGPTHTGFTSDATPDTSRPDSAVVDAPSDVRTTDVGLGEAGAPCSVDSDCDDHSYCNGVEQCLAGFCRTGERPCEDHVSCTIEECTESSHTCRHVPNDAVCADAHACNGIERCAPTDPGSDPTTGCQPVQPDNMLDCNDNNDCTIDSCDDATGCVHGARDLDGDGHVEQACTVDGQPNGRAGDDCDDTDPSVHPGATEVCDDGKDNDCDGQVDFQDANAGCVAANDTCDAARVLSGSGTFWTSTNGLTNDVTLSCNPGTARDSVWSFTLASASDVRVSLATTAAGAAVAVTSNCAATGLAELGCSHSITAGGTSSAPQLLLRGVAPGTYFIIAENSSTTPFRLSLQISPPSTAPPGDVCAPAATTVDLVPGTPTTAMLGTFSDDYTLSCNTGLPRNDAVYHLQLAATADVDLDIDGAGGTTFASVRGAPCATGTEIHPCASGTTIHTSLRNLAAGDYFVFVENTQNQPVTITATERDPASLASGDNCQTAPTLALSSTNPAAGALDVPFAPLLLGSDYGTTCGSNGSPDTWRDAVVHYTLATQSDTTVTVTPIGGWTPHFAWQLATTCGGTPVAGSCAASMSQSVAHFTAQNAGDYFVVIESDTMPPAGAGFHVDISAADTASRPAYEACPGADVPLTMSGAMLTGSTTIDASNPALDNYAQAGTSCGSAGYPTGWTDVVFSYQLAAPSDVTLRFATDPLRAWFSELQSTCGTSSSRVRPTGPAGASDCNAHTTGGVGTGTASTYTFANQPAGRYYFVAETSSPDPGSVRLDISALPH